MATTVHEPPKLELSSDPNHGGWHGIPPAATEPDGRRGQLARLQDRRLGGLAAITMTFVAFTSAMVVRQGSSQDWRQLYLAPVLFSTPWCCWRAVDAGECAQTGSGFRSAEYRDGTRFAARWLWLTLGLGIAVRRRPVRAWLRLRARGPVPGDQSQQLVLLPVHRRSWPHILGGLVGLGLVIVALRPAGSDAAVSTLSTVAYYWHFMDVLWIYLLLLLWLRI